MNAMDSAFTKASNYLQDANYPHGKDGKDKIAYIAYTVKFPTDVVIDTTKIKESTTTTFFANLSHSVNGQEVTFKIPLMDANWGNIKTAYNNDKQDSSNKKITLEIPYTFNESDKDKEITSSGDFEIHPSARAWNFLKYTIKTDNVNVKLAQGENGNTQSSSTMPDLSNVNADTKLNGDMLIDSETQATGAYKVSDETKAFEITGLLNVKPIQTTLTNIENAFKDPNTQKIQLHVESATTTFTATMELPEGLKFPENAKDNVKLTCSKPVAATRSSAPTDDAFKISEAKIDGNKITVTMTSSKELKSFNDVHDTVFGVGDNLKVTVPVQFDLTKSKPNTNYTIEGSVAGKFTASVAKNQNDQHQNIEYNWGSKQDGTTDGNISFTVYYGSSPAPIPEPTVPEIEYVPSNDPEPTVIVKVEPKMQVTKTGEIATTVSSLGLVTLIAVGAYLAKKH